MSIHPLDSSQARRFFLLTTWVGWEGIVLVQSFLRGRLSLSRTFWSRHTWRSLGNDLGKLGLKLSGDSKGGERMCYSLSKLLCWIFFLLTPLLQRGDSSPKVGCYGSVWEVLLLFDWQGGEIQSSSPLQQRLLMDDPELAESVHRKGQQQSGFRRMEILKR